MVNNITNTFLKVKDYYTNFTGQYSDSLSTIKDYVVQLYSSKLIIFLVVGIIVSFVFFSVLSFLFRTPFIIVVGLFIGYGMYKMYLSNETTSITSPTIESWSNRF